MHDKIMKKVNKKVFRNDTSKMRQSPYPSVLVQSSLKNQVRRTGFLTCKNQFQNLFLQATQSTQAVKIQFEID